MSRLAIPLEAFEEHATQLILQMQKEYTAEGRCKLENFDRIKNLLMAIGKESWAVRPRTYAVLHMMNRTDLMDGFIEEDLRDIHFPYSETRLPAFLSEMSDRRAFIEAQVQVLSDAKAVESMEDGRHRHFGDIADAHFYIGRTLGRGGFGYVHYVRGRLSLQEFALKRCQRGKMFSKDKSLLRVFENDLSILKRLSHEHLVKYVGSYTDPRWVAILMTPVADCDLRAFLDKQVSPNRNALLRQFYGCLAVAVQYLHHNNIRHKDLKPQNILVKENKVLLTDFGTALDWTDKSRATTSGDPGPISFNYAAPEVVDREERSESSDIWSLGCVFVEMTTVLKGYSNEDRKTFFTTEHTGHANFWANQEALYAWLSRLESTSNDNITISWIRDMVKASRTRRLGISTLVDCILTHQDEQTYYGPCCADHDHSDSASDAMSAVYENTTESDIDSLYTSGDRTSQRKSQKSIRAADESNLPFPYDLRDESKDELMHTNIQQKGDNDEAVTNEIRDTDQMMRVLPERKSIGDGTGGVSSTGSMAVQTGIQVEAASYHPDARETELAPPPKLTHVDTGMSYVVGKHGGGFDPGPGSSQAVKAVDQLLGVSNGRLRPAIAESLQSDRIDALWQYAYLMHETEARFRMGLVPSTLLATSYPYVYQHPSQRDQDSYAPVPIGLPDGPMQGNNQTVPRDLLSVINNEPLSNGLSEARQVYQESPPQENPTTAPPLWENMMQYTGVSFFRA